MDKNELRFDAYYYGFCPTGVRCVDLVLSAVATAGKAYHHTDSWNDEAGAPDYLQGDTPVEWVQNAAEDAADRVKRLEAALRAAREAFVDDNDIAEGAAIIDAALPSLNEEAKRIGE